MCSLTHPFNANNLQFLALKIVRGGFAPLPNNYSFDLKNLIKSMLNTNPIGRPNINQILSSPLINKRIKQLLT
jgi:NIMA (never in mitosis gene a)-related kinase